MFIDQNYAKQFNVQPLKHPLLARNMDGTENKCGRITSFVDLDLTIYGRTKRTRLLVTGLGKQRIILGFPWLNEQNPEINWATGEFKWRKRFIKIKRIEFQQTKKLLCNLLANPEPKYPKLTITEEQDEQENWNRTQNPLEDTELSVLIATITGETDNDTWINAKSTTSTTIQAEINQKKDTLPL